MPGQYSVEVVRQQCQAITVEAESEEEAIELAKSFKNELPEEEWFILEEPGSWQFTIFVNYDLELTPIGALEAQWLKDEQQARGDNTEPA